MPLLFFPFIHTPLERKVCPHPSERAGGHTPQIGKCGNAAKRDKQGVSRLSEPKKKEKRAGKMVWTGR